MILYKEVTTFFISIFIYFAKQIKETEKTISTQFQHVMISSVEFVYNFHDYFWNIQPI